MIRWRSQLKWIAAGALALVAASAYAGQITLYERQHFQGRSITTSDGLSVVATPAFGSTASAVVVSDGVWEACNDSYFRGRCAELVPGNYAAIDVELNGRVASVRPVAYVRGVTPVVVNPQPVVVNPAPVVINAQPVVINPAPVVVSPQPVVTAQPIVVAPQPAVISPQPTVITPQPVVTVIATDSRIVLYQRGWRGTRRSVELTASVADLRSVNFDDRATGALVKAGVWRLCDGSRQCTDFPPGNYETLGALDGRVASAELVGVTSEPVAGVTPVPTGRAILYEYPNFGGAWATIDRGQAKDLDWAHFSKPGHRATSIRVESGTWLVCPEIGFAGDCRVLGPGEYPQLSGSLVLGIASARQVWRPEYGALTVYTR
jgi:hypothetical protein